MRSTRNHWRKPGDCVSRWNRVGPLAAIAGIGILFLTSNTPAQTQPQPAPVRQPAPSNRFLFVVDTSSAMKKQIEPILLAVRGILANNANQQMRTGDTLGIWTFNNDLFTGRFPLQTWDADDADALAMRAVEFIGRQPFEKRSHLDKALTRLNEVIHASDLITVFIISSGEGKMAGTPFDQTINRYYEQDLKEMGKSRMPLVTVLEAKGGQIYDFTVNALPWPVVIHPLPIPPLPVEPPPVAIAPPASPVPDPALPNGLVELPKGSPPTQPVVIRGTPPKPVESNAILVTVPLQPMTTAQLITNLPSTSPAIRSELAALPPAVNIATDAVVSIPPPVVKTAPIPAPAPPVPVVAVNIPPPAVTTAPAAKPASEAAPWKTDAIPIPALAVVPSPPAARSNEMFVLGLAFLAVGIGLILLLVRRSRATSGPSLITHSMGNPRK